MIVILTPVQPVHRLLVVLATVVLAGCTPAQPILPAPTPSESAEPPPTVEPTLDPRPTAPPPHFEVAPAPTQDSTPLVTPTVAPVARDSQPTMPPQVPVALPTALLPTTRVLDVPLHRQEHALSCEAAALEMAMGTLGAQVSEDELLANLARDPTPRTMLANGTVRWGNPDIGYVGQWDGIFARDGYGVYDGPISDLARAYGFEGTSHGQGVDPTELYDALRQGFPSVVWVPYDLTVKGRGAWTTPAGERVDYVVTEHAVVLSGVDEIGVLYADPFTASLRHALFDDFESAMSELGNRAVTVRP
jgi:uncharacterized protein YvpB